MLDSAVPRTAKFALRNHFETGTAAQCQGHLIGSLLGSDGRLVPADSQPNLAVGYAEDDLGVLPDYRSLVLRDSNVATRELHQLAVQGLFAFAGQGPSSTAGVFVSPSASQSILITALALREMGARRVAVPNPTYGKIPEILRLSGLSAVAFSEGTVDEVIEELSGISQVDAVVLAMPNNPTGWMLDQEPFLRLSEYLARAGSVLVADLAYRWFSPVMSAFSQYDTLARSGVRHVIIEDTGKVLPAGGFKLSTIASCEGCQPALRRVCATLTRHLPRHQLETFAALWAQRAIAEYLTVATATVRENRELAVSRLANFGWRPVTTPGISTQMFEIPNADDSLFISLRAKGVYVLPSVFFYWDQPRHVPAIRITLLHRRSVFNCLLGDLERAVVELDRV